MVTGTIIAINKSSLGTFVEYCSSVWSKNLFNSRTAGSSLSS